MVEKLDSYPWSSYPVYIGKRKPLKWLEIDWLLSLFDKRPKEASKKYRSYVEGVGAREIKNPEKEFVRRNRVDMMERFAREDIEWTY